MRLVERIRMESEVLFVFPHQSSFIEQDLSILNSAFDLDVLIYRRRSDLPTLLRRLMRARVAIAWFVLGYAYSMVQFSRLRRTKTVLVAGGWDVEALPEYEYGAMRDRAHRRRISYALAHADKVLAVSEFTSARVRFWAPSASVEVLYHGFDDARFSRSNGERLGVMTVARVSPETWRLKGLETFVGVARRLPAVSFMVVGEITADRTLARRLPQNVRLMGQVSQDDLIRLYQRSKVYAQLSAVESFGCSLAEAMLCGCSPVVTNRGALPEVVGEVGSIVPYGDVEATVAAVRNALEDGRGADARARIGSSFRLEDRKRNLIKCVRDLLEAS